jgi:hypothetical protein
MNISISLGVIVWIIHDILKKYPNEMSRGRMILGMVLIMITVALNVAYTMSVAGTTYS